MEKLENNVVDILTKNLEPRLFEKHTSELVTDVGFFVRCNTRRIEKAETWDDTNWAKEERLQDLAEPMGKIQKYDHDGYRITKWYPDYERPGQLKKRVQGPLQRNYWNRKYD